MAAALILVLPLWGLAIGSFIGLLSLRLPEREPVMLGRSACRGCGRTLRAHQLVPLASYLIQRGRCVACGIAIPWRYPALEAASAAIGIVASLTMDGVAPVLLAALLGWWLLLLAVLDFEHFWLPRAATVPLLVAGIGGSFVDGSAGTVDRLIGAGAGYLSLAALSWLYLRLRGRAGLGGGDPVLFGAAGAWVGWQGLPWVLVGAAWSGLAFVAITSIWRRWSGESRLPFGCFLAPAIWLVYLLHR